MVKTRVPEAKKKVRWFSGACVKWSSPRDPWWNLIPTFSNTGMVAILDSKKRRSNKKTTKKKQASSRICFASFHQFTFWRCWLTDAHNVSYSFALENGPVTRRPMDTPNFDVSPFFPCKFTKFTMIWPIWRPIFCEAPNSLGPAVARLQQTQERDHQECKPEMPQGNDPIWPHGLHESLCFWTKSWRCDFYIHSNLHLYSIYIYMRVCMHECVNSMNVWRYECMDLCM